MTGDLLINGKDAYSTWGVCMGNGFLEALLTPPPSKELISNKSRVEHGKRVIANNPKVDERELTLYFTIQGGTPASYIERYKSFMNEIGSGIVTISVPALGNEKYRVYYKNAISYSMNISRTFSKLAVKMCEPNPGNRA